MKGVWRFSWIFILGFCFMRVEEDTRGDFLSRMQGALNSLNQLPTGVLLIQKAQLKWNQPDILGLLHYFSWGKASRTNTILTRHFNPQTGRDDQERAITIFLKEDQTAVELALDLAHELVHATSRSDFDPYDFSLTPAKYIYLALEGEGGEIEAVMKECQIGLEWMQHFGVLISRCQAYYRYSGNLGHQGKLWVDQSKVRQDFYRVGKWEADLRRDLGSEVQSFPLLSNHMPKFYSSISQAPYPFVLFHEFQEMNQLACDNSRKRLAGIILSRDSISTLSSEVQIHRDLNRFIKSRCK